MDAPKCEHCQGSMPVLKRTDARYCSSRCRTAAHRARKTLPAEMTSKRRWVRRTARKMPLTTAGRAASSTDARTWTSYTAAKRSTVGAGLGYVLADDGIVCIDLDHCLDRSGRLADWARTLLNQMPATFVEVSPSGTGLHIFGRGRVGRGRRIRSGGRSIEVYGCGRYIAVTGDRFEAAPPRLADISAVVATLT
jgi:primase-polymerase (primpol)-like protein